MTTASAIIYECGICGHCHPWDWNGDCRDDDNRFTSDEYAERLGIPESELDIRSWEERCEADGDGDTDDGDNNVACIACGRTDTELHTSGRCGHCGP